MSEKSILLIVEGDRTEPKLFKSLLTAFGLDFDYKIYPYQTVIYDLYERMFSRGLDEANMLTLQGVLIERENDSIKRELLKRDFTDIVLIFDYDPHDHRFNPEHIETMQEYFNESTDAGKLYINYPMIEACKHFHSADDQGFLSRRVSLPEIMQYKKIVGEESAFPHLGEDYSRDIWRSIILLTLKKAASIAKSFHSDLNIKKCYEELDLKNVAIEQNGFLKAEESIYVLGTCVLFICDYSISLLSA